MYKAEITTKSARATMDAGKNVALSHPLGGVFCLYGTLGAGKTVFAKGFAEGLGIPEKLVKSPTYTLLRTYPAGKKRLHHFDFYRLENTDDLLAHEITEILNEKNSWILIEWPERIEKLLPENRVNIRFSHTGENERLIRIA